MYLQLARFRPDEEFTVLSRFCSGQFLQAGSAAPAEKYFSGFALHLLAFSNAPSLSEEHLDAKVVFLRSLLASQSKQIECPDSGPEELQMVSRVALDTFIDTAALDTEWRLFAVSIDKWPGRT